MGFLGKLFGKKENDTIENTVTQQITTEKDLQNQNDEESNSPMMPIDMTKDHIFPHNKGGKNNISNYQTMCVKCNVAKGSRIL